MEKNWVHLSLSMNVHCIKVVGLADRSCCLLTYHCKHSKLKNVRWYIEGPMTKYKGSGVLVVKYMLPSFRHAGVLHTSPIPPCEPHSKSQAFCQSPHGNTSAANGDFCGFTHIHFGIVPSIVYGKYMFTV